MKIQKEEWPIIILGLRKRLRISQSKLAEQLKIGRKTISRYERGSRIPSPKYSNKIINYIKQQKISIEEIKRLGKRNFHEIKEREKLKALKLDYSEELAELIGVILGDGSLGKDGCVNIALDFKKDINHFNRRVIPLMENFTNNKVYKHQRSFVFNDISFMRFLENNCKIKPGKKTENGWKIPDWCFRKEKYLKAVLRGIFDSDGCFFYDEKVVLMFGRFSDKCFELAESIKLAFDRLQIKTNLSYAHDRYKIETNRVEEVLKFFIYVGSSNLKHITRFLLWRLNRYKAKIELEGLPKLISNINKSINFDVRNIRLPFLWAQNNKRFVDYVKEDLIFLENLNIRNNHKWDLFCKDLLRIRTSYEVAKVLNILPRSIRKWREGKRNPSPKFIPGLLKLAKENNLNLSQYRI